MQNFNGPQFATSAFESLDFLREKLNAARERCNIVVNDKPVVGLPTITDALNLMDPFVVKCWDDKTWAAKTPIWSPLFPYFWWEAPVTTSNR